ncbi:hypothetical protein MMC27_003407 [Xylographa pallens]|nr:hypothetical protein [Xylographa pallens]
MSSPNPIQIHIPSTLTPFAVPLTSYLTTHPSFSRLAISACIFAPAHLSTPPTTRLLLLHRAHTEPSFRNLWEIPGGGVEATDPTVLHALAREVFEETGLHLTRFIRQVGPGEVLTGGDESTPIRCQRLSFEIEVAEMGSVEAPLEEERDGMAARGLSVLEDVRVVVDPAEHQGFRWVSEAEVRDATCLVASGETGYFGKRRAGWEHGQGEGEVKLVFEDQQQVMLEAFAMHVMRTGGHPMWVQGRMFQGSLGGQLLQGKVVE